MAHACLELEFFLGISVPFAFFTEFYPISWSPATSVRDISLNMAIDVCQFSASIVRRCDQVCRIVLSQNGKGLIISALFDVAVGCQVAA